MLLRIHGGKDAASTSESFVPSLSVEVKILTIYLFIEAWVADMELMRGDTNDRACEKRVSGATGAGSAGIGTILIVKLGYLLRILSLEDDFVVGFVPARDRGQLGTGKLGQRVCVQAVQHESGAVDEGSSGQQEGQGRPCWSWWRGASPVHTHGLVHVLVLGRRMLVKSNETDHHNRAETCGREKKKTRSGSGATALSAAGSVLIWTVVTAVASCGPHSSIPLAKAPRACREDRLQDAPKPVGQAGCASAVQRTCLHKRGLAARALGVGLLRLRLAENRGIHCPPRAL